jgi:hypothetical protein
MGLVLKKVLLSVKAGVRGFCLASALLPLKQCPQGGLQFPRLDKFFLNKNFKNKVPSIKWELHLVGMF